MKLRVIAILAVLALGWLGWNVVSTIAGRGDDAHQINVALDGAIRASKSGSPGSVLDLLSKEFTLNRAALPVDRAQVATFIRDYKPDVAIPVREVQIQGDQAKIESPIDLSLLALGSRQITNATFRFHREDDRIYGIFPTTSWRLTDITLADDSFSQF